MRLAAALAYNLALFAGFAYLIGWRGWSPWWMLLAIVLCCSITTEEAHS